MKQIWIKITLLIVCALIISTFFILRKAGASRQIGEPLEKGNIEVPVKRTGKYNSTSALREEIIEHWATSISEKWTDGEKVGLKNSRVVLGSLAAGKRIEEMNQYLLNQKSTGTAGSRWLLNLNGGYNFNTMACTPILYFFLINRNCCTLKQENIWPIISLPFKAVNLQDMFHICQFKIQKTMF